MSDTARILQIIPADGWTVEAWTNHEQKDDGKWYHTDRQAFPVIAWALCIYEHGPDPVIEPVIWRDKWDGPRPISDYEHHLIIDIYQSR